MPKVSIIMPTFNRGWIIAKAITSILNQTHTDFEVLIIDDGSVDNTKEVIAQFHDERIIPIFLKENKGTSAARNEGIRQSKGSLIAYLDSDNVWYPNFLEVMISELTENLVLVYSAQNTFLMGGDKNNLKVIARKVRDYPYNPDALTKGNFIDINAVMHTKKVFEEIGGFDVNLKTLEDWDFFAQIALKYPFKIKHVGQVLGEYYFFLRETEVTSVNSFLTNDSILLHFNVKEPEGDYKIVIDKIKNKLANNSK